MNRGIIIVGASLAGCSTAILLARAGHRVTVIERVQSIASFKRVCTHLIQNAAIPTLERLGLLEPMLQAGALPSVLNIWFRSNWIRMSPNATHDERGPTWNLNLRREVLDPMVRQLAMSTPGIELRFGVSLESLIEDKGRVVGVQVSCNGQKETLLASLVIGADGRNSKVASLAQIPCREFPNIRGGWGAYYRNVRPGRQGKSSDTHFWLLEPDIAYVFPTDSELTLLATITTQDKLPDLKKNIESNHLQSLGQLPDGPDLSQAERASEFFGMMKAPGYYRNPNRRLGMTLVGDAALTTDFVWGDGCSNAFRSAEMLADAIGPAREFKELKSLDISIKKYGKQHARVLYAAHAQNAIYSQRERLEWTRSIVFKAARTNPKVQQLMFEVQTGRVDGTRGGIQLLVRSIFSELRNRFSTRSKKLEILQ
jgi:menaquinone-9 beta-reductase